MFDETHLPVSITISMDSRMAQILEIQAEIEGYLNLESYLHSIILRDAVRVKIESLPDVESPDQAIAYISELHDWVRGGPQ
jgi:hypothetical protein